MLFSVVSIPAQVYADSGKVGLTGSAAARNAKYSLSGDFSFTVGSNGWITGSGSGNAFVDWQAEAQGTGIMCTAKESHDVSLSITGKYNSETGLIKFQISSSPTTFSLKMNCPGIEFLSGNTYDVPNPFNMAGNSIEMPLQTGASGSKTFSISQGSATLSGTIASAGIQSTGGSSSYGESSSSGSSFDFDFDIDVPTFANVIQGETIDVGVIIKYIRGEGGVSLSATNFIQFNVFSTFSPNGVSLPSSKTANLEVVTTCHTIPDTYRITVRGAASTGTRTSVDTVTVNVLPNKACGSMAITAADIELVNKYLEISVAYFNRGEYEKAIIELDKVIKLSPGNWAAYSNKGWALYQLGDDQGAAKHCGVALKSKPQDFSTLKCLGYANEKLGLTNQARSFYELALQIKPHDSAVTRHLSELEEIDIEVPDDLRDAVSSIVPQKESSPPFLYGEIYGKSKFLEKRKTHLHEGVDYAVPIGTPVASTTDAKVVRSEMRDGCDGNQVILYHGEDNSGKGVYTVWLHLDKMNVKKGDTVKAGVPFAESGDSKGKNCTSTIGKHLHLEVRKIPNNLPINGPDDDAFWDREHARDPESIDWLNFGKEFSEIGETDSSFDVEISGPTTVREKVPGWIKNNAKWWSEGTISDSDFTNGIQYMIKEKIINIPDLPKSADSVPSFDVEISGPTTVKEKVPGWIKNNAEWWANGLIGEDDFVNGIKYLVEKGIIKI